MQFPLRKRVIFRDKHHRNVTRRYYPCSLEQKMGHKKMFNGPEGNQRRSDKQNFGFLANGGSAAHRQAMNGNSTAMLSVSNCVVKVMFHVSRDT